MKIANRSTENCRLLQISLNLLAKKKQMSLQGIQYVHPRLLFLLDLHIQWIRFSILFVSLATPAWNLSIFSYSFLWQYQCRNRLFAKGKFQKDKRSRFVCNEKCIFSRIADYCECCLHTRNNIDMATKNTRNKLITKIYIWDCLYH